jgi:multisubunit Na+/H+ antiporter MnhC subunit
MPAGVTILPTDDDPPVPDFSTSPLAPAIWYGVYRRHWLSRRCLAAVAPLPQVIVLTAVSS